ncbi:MAG: hypothetical protein AB8H80_12985 [Planctomycetota bacterium]
MLIGLFALALPAQNWLPQLPGPVDSAPNGFWYGPGCGGLPGTRSTISVSPAMRPGRLVTMQVDATPPSAVATLMIGWDAQDWLGLTLPLPLDSVGMPGCHLMVAPVVSIPFVGSTLGSDFVSYTVPADPVLVAAPLFFQTLFQQTVPLSYFQPPAGLGVSRGYTTRVEPSGTPTTLQSSISQHGITFQFANPVPVGQFVNGDYFVVGPATVVGMTPPCALQAGRVVNGAMVNPDPSIKIQGYDSQLFDPGDYQTSRNVAWGLSAQSPLYLGPNQSLIKVISNTDPQHLPALQTCSVLTTLYETPPQGSFRPPYAGLDHAVRFDVQMLDLSVLPEVTPPAARPDLLLMAANFERPWLDHAPGWGSRYMHPVDNMPDYGRDLAALYNEAALMCLTTGPDTEKRELAMRLVQIGIDFFGNVEGGAFWEGTGGHGSGRKLPILLAGQLLGDAKMLSVGVDYPSYRMPDGTNMVRFGEDGQTFYVEQTGAGEFNWGHGGYDSSHVGLADFGFSHMHQPQFDDVTWTGNSYRRCCTANGWIGAVLYARMTGLVDDWNHPALFDYTDRYATIETAGWTLSWLGWTEAMWHQYRPNY